MMMMNTLERSSALTKRKIRLLLDRSLRNKYVSDQLKVGLRNQLRSLRDERGMTQAELAEHIGTKQSVISRIEKNPMRVGLPVFLDIAEKLDVAFVCRFEAIDTFVEWYDNLTPKKMTPDKSEQILRDRAKRLLAHHTAVSETQVTRSTSVSVLLDTDGAQMPAPSTPPVPIRWEGVILLKNVDIIEERSKSSNYERLAIVKSKDAIGTSVN